MTDSETTYQYYEGLGPKGVYGQLKGAITYSTTQGTDIWGATYVTTSTTEYTIIHNRAFAYTVDSTTQGSNLFGESYTTTSHTEYEYYEGLGPNGVYGELKSATGYSTTTGKDLSLIHI